MNPTPEKITNLARLAEILNYVGMPAHYAAPSEKVPFEELLVALDNPETAEEPKYLVKLFFVEDLLTPAAEVGPEFEAERASTSTLQIYLEQELELNPEKALDTYRLVTIFGRLIPVGGSLGILENAEGSDVYYSYCLPTEQKGLNATWVIDILETLQFYLTGFLPQLHAFQTNQQSLAEVAAEIQAELQGMLNKALENPPSAN